PLEQRRRYADDSRDEIGLRRPMTPHRGAAVLTFGILSIAIPICAPVLGPVAWIMGYNDLQAIRAGYMDRSGEGITQAGMIIGMVMTILCALVLGFFCLGAMLGAMRHGFR